MLSFDIARHHLLQMLLLVQTIKSDRGLESKMADLDKYQTVANKKDLQEGGLLKAEFLGKSIVLSMVKGNVYAIDAVCSHEGGPLEDGTLDGYEVECPWHGSKFDVRTGEITNPPAETPQLAYEVKVENDKILVKEKTGG